MGNTGLSIPFLVGAQEILIENFRPSIKDIDVLLDEIFSFDLDDEFIRIKWCSSTKCYVIGLCDVDDVIDSAIYMNTIVAGDLLRKVGMEIADVKNGLKELYSEQITERLYSRNNGEWTSFTDSDIKFILNSN